ncbi:MAG: hydroxysqualene dehydroxylase HpnE [Burkholderiales bacterium]
MTTLASRLGALAARKRVAIVGGGYAGMAAATELSAAGLPVVVFETARVLGGRARRVDVAGIPLDNGLHILLGAYRETLRLINLVKRQGEPGGLLSTPLELSIHPAFHLKSIQLPAPLHLAWALLSARGLAWRDRAQAALFMTSMRMRRFILDEDCSVSDLMAANHQPDSVRRYLWHPLCVAALNTLPEQASAQVFLNVLRDSLHGRRRDSDLLLPTMDFSALFPERAARFVHSRGGKVRLGATVDALRIEPDGFALEPDAGRFSDVILAVPAHRLGALLAPHPRLAHIQAKVDALEHRPIYSVYLQYPETTRLPFNWGGLEAEYSQWVFDRGQLTGQAGLIGVVISSNGAHQELDQDDLAQRVHTELRTHFGVPDTLLWHRVIAEKRATFACTPGLRRPESGTPIAGLYLAGDFIQSDYPATLEAAVRSGVQAANLVMQRD